MNHPAILVESLSKLYRIGLAQARHDTLRDLLVDTARSIGRRFTTAPRSSEDELWALKDVSFQVQPGEVVGIIGRNGAGKSTLLKILSRITEPTSGRAVLNGRVGSLLEVGTGFHPELTGRENIYLNGAVLGMHRVEIERKFDEIVAFSGIGRFLDTPVKRYSSGMYVRLAFSVASHLEPEILIVDEVLSVGDAEFQKKCLGRMGEVAGEGRTVLFVSHNMQAVQNLCDRALVLDEGHVVFKGFTEDAVSYYLQTALDSRTHVAWEENQAPGNEKVRLLSAWIRKETPDVDNHAFTVNDRLEIGVEFLNHIPGETVLNITLHLRNEQNILIFVTGSSRANGNPLKPGKYLVTCQIPGNLLHQGTYTINKLLFVQDHGRVVYEQFDCLIFNVIMPDEGKFGWMGKKEGVVRPRLDWELKPLD